MLRGFIVLFALANLCRAQSFPVFRWIVETDASGLDRLAGLGTDSQGNVYLAGTTGSPAFSVKSAVQDRSAGSSDVFVSKLDPSGNLVYSTYFGGSGIDTATAMAVDARGNVYVTGTTTSTDFPVTPGAYLRSLSASSTSGAFGSFLFRLAADGAVSYATYFSSSPSLPGAIAVDAAGSVWIAGLSYGGLATTPGAYRTACVCVPPSPPFSFGTINDAFLARFDPAGSRLLFATYLGAPLAANALAVSADGSAYVAGTPTRVGSDSVFLLNAIGTSLLASADAGLGAQAAALASDGSLYLAGPAANPGKPFVATPGAFQQSPGLAPDANSSQTGIVRMDPQLRTLSGTYFGGAFGNAAKAIAVDAAGAVYVGGYTSSRSLPTRTPLVQGFGGGITGYVAKFNGDLSDLLFSSEFGDNEVFAVSGVSIGANGDLVLGGSTGAPNQNVWVNSLAVPAPEPLRIDAVTNLASRLSDPISSGQIILVQGAGFVNGAQLLISGKLATPIYAGVGRVIGIVPFGLTGSTATVQVISGGVASNVVLSALTP